MQEIVGSVHDIKFDIEVSLEDQYGAQSLPFPGMDKSGAAVCTFFIQGSCQRGQACPFRHVKQDRTVVCKHWLRRLCKKGDDCEFLHEYDMSKMPECYFFSKFGQCGNKECPFLHIDPEQKVKDCPWYDRGYCRHGPACKNRHARRVICQNYLCGFCLDGPSCRFSHASFDIPAPDPVMQAKKATMVCHKCGDVGHKAFSCPKTSDSYKADPNTVSPQRNSTNYMSTPAQPTQQPGGHHPHQHPHHAHHHPYTGRRSLEEVTCYKCGEKGHFATRCNKGYLAFLSDKAQTVQPRAVDPQNLGL